MKEKRKSAAAYNYQWSHWLAKRGMFMFYPPWLTWDQLIENYNARHRGGNWRQI